VRAAAATPHSTQLCFENSRIQLLSPERLNALTGLFFVQLSVPGTGPKEQLTLTNWFMRHHPEALAVVIGADKTWCTADAAMRGEHPFPYWLYSADVLEYARGLLRFDVIQEIGRRLGYLLAKRPDQGTSRWARETQALRRTPLRSLARFGSTPGRRSGRR
jgi:hypothetical protein